MEITCLQMDVLISFYIDGDLSETLKAKVEEHLENCPVCKAKFNIISSLFLDNTSSNTNNKEEVFATNTHSIGQYQFFKKNLSAYVDNELSEEDNVKIRKYTINNKKARKDLEDTYNIRKIMKDSYRKTNSSSKPDYAKNIVKKLDVENQKELEFNPLISIGFAFIMSVILITAIVVYMLSLD